MAREETASVNRMGMVANILGVELEEEFRIIFDGKLNESLYVITRNIGLTRVPNRTYSYDYFLKELITGRFKIAKIK